MKHFKFLVILFLSCVVMLSACRKPVEQGATITASGIVFDSVKNKPLKNAKLYLYGAKQTFYGIGYTDGPIDSTISDVLGKFTMTFIADGKNIDYGLTLGQLEYGGYNYGNLTNYVIDNLQPMYKFNYSRNVTNAIVRARELNFTKVYLKVISNPFDSFLVRTSALRQATLIKGQSIDTIILLRHLPNEQNRVEYYTEATRDTVGLAAANSNPNGPFTSIRRILRDTIIAGLADTIFINKTISNSSLIPRQ